MDAYEDPEHESNGEKYHTGKVCHTPGCHNPAGTRWSPHWCQKCNAQRMKRRKFIYKLPEKVEVS